MSKKSPTIFDDGCTKYNIFSKLGKLAVVYAPEDKAEVAILLAFLDDWKYVYEEIPIVALDKMPYDGFAQEIDERMANCSCMMLVLSDNLVPDTKDSSVSDYLIKKTRKNRLWFRVGQMHSQTMERTGNTQAADSAEKVFFALNLNGKWKGELPDIPPLIGRTIVKTYDDVGKTLAEDFSDKIIKKEYCQAKLASATIPANVFFARRSFHIDILKEDYDREEKEIGSQKLDSQERLDGYLRDNLRFGAKICGFADSSWKEGETEFVERQNAFDINERYYSVLQGKRQLFVKNKVHSRYRANIILPIHWKFGVSFRTYAYIDNELDEYQIVNAENLAELLFGTKGDSRRKEYGVEVKDGKVFFVVNPNKQTDVNSGVERIYPQ